MSFVEWYYGLHNGIQKSQNYVSLIWKILPYITYITMEPYYVVRFDQFLNIHQGVTKHISELQMPLNNATF